MIWIAIVGSALATYLTRALPFVVTYRGRVPDALSRYLEALPVAIIAALVGPAVIAPSGALTHGAEPVAALVAALVVIWRRSLLAGVVAGVAAVAIARALT
jgi:branched-subunit amino acid transport protein